MCCCAGLYHALIPVQNLPYLEEQPTADMKKHPVSDVMGGRDGGLHGRDHRRQGGDALLLEVP